MTLQNKEAAWFLAQLKPNSAQIAAKNLKRQGFQTFLPMKDETEQRNGKFVTAQRPLLVGYIFVALDTSQGLWRAVNSTYGITRLVSFGTEPAVVPFELVSELMQRCDGSGKLLPPAQLQPGDQMRLTTGPFASFAAEVESIDRDRRVWVLIDLMGRATRMAVHGDHLRAL